MKPGEAHRRNGACYRPKIKESGSPLDPVSPFNRWQSNSSLPAVYNKKNQKKYVTRTKVHNADKLLYSDCLAISARLLRALWL